MAELDQNETSLRKIFAFSLETLLRTARYGQDSTCLRFDSGSRRKLLRCRTFRIFDGEAKSDQRYGEEVVIGVDIGRRL